MAQEAATSRVEAGVQYPSDVAAGLELGRQVAALAIERGQTDNSDAVWDGVIPSGPGLWTGTNPGGVPERAWKPWVLAAPDQLRPDPPPAFGSDELAAELAEVRDFPRTPRTTGLALNWQYGAYGNSVGIVHWTREASQRLHGGAAGRRRAVRRPGCTPCSAWACTTPGSRPRRPSSPTGRAPVPARPRHHHGLPHPQPPLVPRPTARRWGWRRRSWPTSSPADAAPFRADGGADREVGHLGGDPLPQRHRGRELPSAAASPSSCSTGSRPTPEEAAGRTPMPEAIGDVASAPVPGAGAARSRPLSSRIRVANRSAAVAYPVHHSRGSVQTTSGNQVSVRPARRRGAPCRLRTDHAAGSRRWRSARPTRGGS